MDAQALARWSAALDPASLPPATSERVRLQIASIVGSVLRGLRVPQVARARDAFAAAAPPPTGRRTRRKPAPCGMPAEALAPWLSMASMAHDFDDYLLFAHTGHSAALVPIVFGLERNAAFGDVVAAAAAANEIGGRLGGYALIGPHNGQMWTHVHLGATVAALARLEGDPPDVAARAFGLAFANPPFLLAPAFFGGYSKLLAAAVPIRQALLAVRLARATDMAAPAGLFSADGGFGRHFAHAPSEGFFDGLGSVWLTDTLAVKAVPGCAYVSAAADAAAAVRRQAVAALGRAVTPDMVERVEVSATALTTLMDGAAGAHRAGPLSAVEATFSTPLTAALALLDDPFGPGSLDDERLRRDEAAIRSVASKVQVRHDLARTMRLVDGVARPMELLDIIGGLSGEEGTRVGFDLFRRFQGLADSGAPRGATIDGSPFRMLRDRASIETLRSIGGLVAGALGRRRGGARYSLSDARTSEVRFAASAGVLATISGEAFEAECEIPPGAPGSPVDLTDVVRGKLRAAFEASGVAADADEFVGRLLSAAPETPLRDLLAPVASALGAGGAA